MSSTQNPNQPNITPCHLSMSNWPVCYEDNCYLNRNCQVYRGLQPSPERDYIPLPPAFIQFYPSEVIPYPFQGQFKLCDPDQ